ncbi:Nucleoside 2-deoxyribosyltransferase, putative [Leishmania lindenbergi]|uniref:Nucleoside 2-deoxyribosyltransferase n=1 Tax=Leishmania lindenbergi TaxID=651832 RepID=A0AAW3AFI2_9TRYP
MSVPKKIYIAGPAVFHLDHGDAYYTKVRALLKEKGVVPLIPVDNTVSGALNIRNSNLEMIQACDAVIADLSPFRTKEPDCGTAFELGYAAALGKVLLTFSTDTRSMVEKYGGQMAEGLSVEDFGLPFNLMLHNGTDVFDSFEAAFGHFSEKLLSQ